MTNWSLPKLLEALHDDIQQRLKTARETMGHSGAKGDATEEIWLQLLSKYLPERYCAAKAFVVDSRGASSDQIDVVIFDRQYTPFIFKYEKQTIIPAESVYAVFEAKQAINLKHLKYAQEKVTSVRQLHRTSLPIPHAGGTFSTKPLIPIYGGILTFESDWKPALGKPLSKALDDETEAGRIDIGCVSSHGYFFLDKDDNYVINRGGKSTTLFLFKLISKLQSSGTVPMIDIETYSKWIT